MRTLLIGAAAAVALASGPAMAADMPLKGPAPAPYVSWTGFYVGGSFGVARGDMKDFCATNGLCATDGDDTSWTGGGHVGIQWQSGQFVFGAEAKWISTDLNPFGNCPNPAFRCSIHIDDYWTAGARLGYTFTPSSLFYVTGGYAQSRIDRDTVLKVAGLVDESWRATHSGWFIGSGTEFRVAGTGWVLGLEYNHIDFGSKSATSSPGALTGAVTTTSVKATVDTFQARVSYLFNWWGR
jgi:outer membrane immunogenic protein